ncbi:RNA 2',3'-cyclic phosphodiesterase [Pseudomonas aeruginosa]|uniref:RNA 2',3'-cyclic phosphodiesterase n=1 Tax=Pseudomonas aeruginosa TaxID=287 RepID=UPI003FD0A0CA
MPDRFLRLFFALPCPPPLAERIGRWRDDRPLPGRQVATANLHLTLAFLGQVPSARLEALLDMAAAIEAAPFDLYLDRLLRWRNGILLLAPSQPPGALLRLRRALRSGLAELELPVETRSFSAHLTLARDAAPLEDAPLPQPSYGRSTISACFARKTTPRACATAHSVAGRCAGKIQTSVSRRNNPPLPLCHAGYDRPPGSRGFPGLEEKSRSWHGSCARDSEAVLPEGFGRWLAGRAPRPHQPEMRTT